MQHNPILDFDAAERGGKGSKLRRLAILLSLLIPLAPAEVLGTEPQWLTLPPTPTLPQLEQSGTTPVNGIRLWYATFGPRRSSHPTAWRARQRELLGLSGPALQPRYRVIVVDSRGHGRSTRDQRPYGYDLMADDVLGLMDFLKIEKTAIVGWSDGAIVGLDIAMHHPERVTKLFAFAANPDPSGVADIAKSPVFNAFIGPRREGISGAVADP